MSLFSKFSINKIKTAAIRAGLADVDTSDTELEQTVLNLIQNKEGAATTAATETTQNTEAATAPVATETTQNTEGAAAPAATETTQTTEDVTPKWAADMMKAIEKNTADIKSLASSSQPAATNAPTSVESTVKTKVSLWDRVKETYK